MIQIVVVLCCLLIVVRGAEIDVAISSGSLYFHGFISSLLPLVYPRHEFSYVYAEPLAEQRVRGGTSGEASGARCVLVVSVLDGLYAPDMETGADRLLLLGSEEHLNSNAALVGRLMTTLSPALVVYHCGEAVNMKDLFLYLETVLEEQRGTNLQVGAGPNILLVHGFSEANFLPAGLGQERGTEDTSTDNWRLFRPQCRTGSGLALLGSQCAVYIPLFASAFAEISPSDATALGLSLPSPDTLLIPVETAAGGAEGAGKGADMGVPSLSVAYLYNRCDRPARESFFSLLSAALQPRGHSLTALGACQGEGVPPRHNTQTAASRHGSGGRYLAEAMALYRGFDFVVAFENAITSGYVTEKLLLPLLAGALPLYLGPVFPTVSWFVGDPDGDGSVYSLEQLQQLPFVHCNALPLDFLPAGGCDPSSLHDCVVRNCIGYVEALLDDHDATDSRGLLAGHRASLVALGAPGGAFRAAWRWIFAWHPQATTSDPDPAGLVYRRNWFAELTHNLPMGLVL